MVLLVMGSFWAAMRITSTTKPSTKFMTAPATMTSTRCHTGASFRGTPEGCTGASVSGAG